jgi:hypothetical protein
LTWMKVVHQGPKPYRVFINISDRVEDLFQYILNTLAVSLRRYKVHTL